MVPESSSRSTNQAAGVPDRDASYQGQYGWDENTVSESETLVREFLEGRPERVHTVAEWARSVAVHNVWGFENTEDIVQATLLALVQNLREGSFTGGDLRAYVRRIAKNMCISHYRKVRSRGRHISIEESVHSPVPHDLGEAVEHRTLIDRIFERLSDTCRQIILLAYIHGYSRKEISTRLGITERAARVRLYRCIQNARTLLNRFGDVVMEHG